MSTNEFITDYEQYSPFDYLPGDGEILAALQAAHNNGEYLSDVIEAIRAAPLPSDKHARKRVIASIRHEGLMAQWHAEGLRRQGDPAADDVDELARMVSQVASVYGTMRPGVQRMHDEVELEISQHLRKNDSTTDEHWLAFARDMQAVHGEVHRAFQVPLTIEVIPAPVLERGSLEVKTVPGSAMNKKQQIAATALATAILSGVFPSVAHAAAETTSSRPESVWPVAGTTNPNNPNDPANLRALAAPQTNSTIDKNSQGETDAKTVSAHTVVQEDVLAGLTPAVLPVAEVPAAPQAPSNAGTPDIAPPTAVAGLDLIPAPINATPKSLDSTSDAGGTPEVALPVAPALPPVEAVPTPSPAPAPAPKAPEAPAPAPEASKKDPTATDQAFANIVGVNVNVNRHGDKLSAATLTNLLNTSAEKYHHPVITREFILAVLVQESTLDPDITSGAGAVGLAQFIPATAARYGLTNPRDPAAAVDASFHYYTDIYDMLAKKFPHKSQADLVDLTLAGYNAGENNAFIQKGELPPYPETVGYVKVITSHLQRIYDVENAPPAPVLASQDQAHQTPEKVGNVAYTWQMDPALFDMKYADGQVVGLTACGSASLDMIANTIGSKPGHGQVMRTMLADGTLPEGGTSQTFLMNEAPKFGLRTEYIQNYSITAMKKVLDAGGLITFSGRANSQLLPAPGHFVVVYNVNVDDGTMQVADPGNPANNGKFFSLQAEVNAGAADKAKGHMGLHNGFIAYYPTHSDAELASQILPKEAVVTDEKSQEAASLLEAKSAPTATDAAVTTGDSAAQQAVDRAKRAVAAAKAATEQAQREKALVK